MKTRNQVGLISIVAIITMGILATLIPTSVLADISKQQNILTYNTASQTANEKTINQKQLLTDKFKRLIFSFRNGFDNLFRQKTNQNTKATSNGDAGDPARTDQNNEQTTTIEVYPYDEQGSPTNKIDYNKQGRLIDTTETSKNNTNPSKETFWSKLLTLVTNTYNNLGRMIGFSTTEKKGKEEKKETVGYNEQGRSINIIETSKNNSDSFKKTLWNISPTIPTKNSSEDYSDYDNFKLPIDIQPALTDIPAPTLGQTVAREQIISPSPTSSLQRLENALPGQKINILR